ncbi:MAG: hypothetical protein AAF234_13570 [Pseudomonadota bacterium]
MRHGITHAIQSIDEFAMKLTKQTKKAKSANRLYRGGKISGYQFRRVLRAFAGDVPPTRLSQRMILSLNSISGIYQRLRAHYVKIGVFRDFYADGRENRGATDKEAEAYELALLDFHLQRVSRMRGVKPSRGEVDHHFCESCWRFRFAPFFEGRTAEAVQEMMFNELLTYIHVGGPVGIPTPNLRAIKEAQLDFLDRRAAWLERSSPEFKPEKLRSSLREIRRL